MEDFILGDEIIKKYFDAEKAFWEPIGKFVFIFGMLERDVDYALCRLMEIGYQDIGIFVLNELDFLSRVHLLTVYCRSDDEPLRARMRPMVDQLEKHNTFRNNLVHGPWSSLTLDTSRDEVIQWNKIGLSRRHNIKQFEVSVKDIVTKTEEIQNLQDALGGLANDIIVARLARRAESPPSPDKS